MKRKIKLNGIDFIISLPVGIFGSRASSKILKDICNKYDLGPISYAGSGIASFFIGFDVWMKAAWRVCSIRTGVVDGINRINGYDEEEKEDVEDGNSES